MQIEVIQEEEKTQIIKFICEFGPSIGVSVSLHSLESYERELETISNMALNIFTLIEGRNK